MVAQSHSLATLCSGELTLVADYNIEALKFTTLLPNSLYCNYILEQISIK